MILLKELSFGYKNRLTWAFFHKWTLLFLLSDGTSSEPESSSLHKHEESDPLGSQIRSGSYLEHVCVVIVAVLHHHCLVTGQSERDAMLPPAVDSLQQQQVELMLAY